MVALFVVVDIGAVIEYIRREDDAGIEACLVAGLSLVSDWVNVCSFV